jgi:hypothetical protein
VLLKPPIVYLDTPHEKYRFLPNTANELHLLRTTSSIGYATPFMPITISSFKLAGGGVAPGAGPFIVTFYSIHVSAR